jgi:serine/threonine-protein kinase
VCHDRRVVAPLCPGAILDRYEIVRLVARGGMGSVWQARMHGKHGFERRVAVKTILPEHAEDERFRKMLLDEAKIASAIDHPNVVRLLDLGETEDVLYLVMDWVDGVTLEQLARFAERDGGALPFGVAVHLVADLCAGLHAAHELRDARGGLLGVVHRDVSPSNVIVSDKGVATLIDFGIATARDRVSADTSAGRLKGKPGYIAPEQAMRRRIDRRVDVWAAGAVLFRLLAHEPPFTAVDDLLDYINARTAVPLPAAAPAIVAECVRRALAVRPEHRFPTAAAMGAALEGAMKALDSKVTAEDVGRLAAAVSGRGCPAGDAATTETSAAFEATSPASTRAEAPASKRKPR